MYTTRWQRCTPFGYGLCVQSCSRHFISDTTQMHLHIIAYALREYRVFRPSPEFWRQAWTRQFARWNSRVNAFIRLKFHFRSEHKAFCRCSPIDRQTSNDQKTSERRTSEYSADKILSTSRNTVYARAAWFYG